MKELNRTDRLTIATILVAIILVIGLVTIRKPEISFTRSIDETVRLVNESGDIILPEEISNIMNAGSGSFLLVDTRNPVTYQKSHIDLAINIPAQDILKADNLKAFSKLSKKKGTIIIYGKDRLEANGVWMILKQLGFDNIRVLEGGYDGFTGSQSKVYGEISVTANKSETPLYNYNEILNSFGAAVTSPDASKQEPVRVVKKEKKSAAEGGC
jgi:rhodanese-related sulfurtransferase